MNKQEMNFIMQFSLFKYFDAILDTVQAKGLSAFSQADIKKASAQLDSFLPQISEVAKIVFSYHYIYQLNGKPFNASEIANSLNIPSLYLEYESAWRELAKLGLLVFLGSDNYVMPQKVIDAVAVIDMEYYWPNRAVIPAIYKKELFLRWIAYEK